MSGRLSCQCHFVHQLQPQQSHTARIALRCPFSQACMKRLCSCQSVSVHLCMLTL